MNKKFSSRICTTKEQSGRLLGLGLRKETADCHYEGRKNRYEEWEVAVIGGCYYSYDFPAWSLHRLIEMMPNMLQNLYQLDFSKRGVYYADFSNGSYNIIECFTNRDISLYDNIIDCIEWLIKQGYFNKEYLN